MHRRLKRKKILHDSFKLVKNLNYEECEASTNIKGNGNTQHAAGTGDNGTKLRQTAIAMSNAQAQAVRKEKENEE